LKASHTIRDFASLTPIMTNQAICMCRAYPSNTVPSSDHACCLPSSSSHRTSWMISVTKLAKEPSTRFRSSARSADDGLNPRWSAASCCDDGNIFKACDRTPARSERRLLTVYSHASLTALNSFHWRDWNSLEMWKSLGIALKRSYTCKVRIYDRIASYHVLCYAPPIVVLVSNSFLLVSYRTDQFS